VDDKDALRCRDSEFVKNLSQNLFISVNPVNIVMALLCQKRDVVDTAYTLNTTPIFMGAEQATN
jgi:hypothetical protein